MKPERFIREFGVEKAREVVEGAPEGSSHLQAIGSGKLIHYFGVKDEDVQLFFIDHWRPTCFDPSERFGSLVSVRMRNQCFVKQRVV